jgi:hypothetical protein
MSTSPVIRITDLRKSFGDIEVPCGVDLDIERGSILALRQRFGAAGFNDAEIVLARNVDALAREWDLRAYQVSLSWLLSRPAVGSVIVGAETARRPRGRAPSGREPARQPTVTSWPTVRRSRG